MKKLICLLMVLSVAFCICGCDGCAGGNDMEDDAVNGGDVEGADDNQQNDGAEGSGDSSSDGDDELPDIEWGDSSDGAIETPIIPLPFD